METKLVDQLIQFAVLHAGRSEDWQRRELGPIHIVKHLYLADLKVAEQDGKTLTDADWRFHHFGPWSTAVFNRIDPALERAEKRVFQSQYDSDATRWKWFDDELYERLQVSLPHRAISAIKRAIRDFGTDTYELLHYVYATPPMLNAKPGDLLRFVVRESAAPRSLSEIRGKKRALTKKQLKRIEAAKAEVSRRLAGNASPPETGEFVEPRYDEVFEEGTKWLDSLAGSSPEAGQVEVQFDDSVWLGGPRSDERD